jgi:hypothetical protein
LDKDNRQLFEESMKADSWIPTGDQQSEDIIWLHKNGREITEAEAWEYFVKSRGKTPPPF